MPTIDFPKSAALVRQVIAVPSVVKSMATPSLGVGRVRSSDFLLVGVASAINRGGLVSSRSFFQRILLSFKQSANQCRVFFNSGSWLLPPLSARCLSCSAGSVPIVFCRCSALSAAPMAFRSVSGVSDMLVRLRSYCTAKTIGH